MKYYVFNDEVYIKAKELIDFASKEDNNKIEVKGRIYASPVCCKDCKQWDAELECCTSYTIVKCTDGREGVSSDADDFCSRGEKNGIGT